MKYSIIVPIYNKRRVLEESLIRIQNQKINDFEVILCDDGSDDGSEDICRKFALNDNRFKYLHKENGGPSSARNLGLNFASGDFILFVDADDKVAEFWLETIDSFIRKESFDVLSFSFRIINESTGADDETVLPEIELRTRNDVKKNYIYLMEQGGFRVVWNKVFRRSLLIKENIVFDERIRIGEDWKFCLEVLQKCSSWGTISTVLYSYSFQQKNAISSSIYMRKMHDLLIVHGVYSEVLDLSGQDNNQILAKKQYNLLRIFTSQIMDIIRKYQSFPKAYIHARKITARFVDRFSEKVFQNLHGENRLTYVVWTTHSTFFIVFYSYLLVLYRYKLKFRN